MTETKGSLTKNPVSAADQIDKDLLPKYKKLKLLFAEIGGKQGNIKKAKDAYQAKRKETATLCREIYLAEKSQGNRNGGGFEANLKTHLPDVNKNKAYRLMTNFFEDTPKIDSKRQLRSERAKSSAEFPQLALVDLTADERSQFNECLGILNAGEITRVVFDAVIRYAEEKRNQPVRKLTFLKDDELECVPSTLLGQMEQAVAAEVTA